MNKKQQAIEEARGMLEMYKRGFLDGYLYASKTKIKKEKVWKLIKQDCLKSFEKSFKKIFKEKK